MSQYSPTGVFQWVNDCEHLVERIAKYPTNSTEGYILEVDLEYLDELHIAHNGHPLALERLVVQKEWMTEYQLGLRNVRASSTEVQKLVPNLRNKEREVKKTSCAA